MQFRHTVLSLSIAGILAVGAFDAGRAQTSAQTPQSTATGAAALGSTSPSRLIPPMTAPNYRAIVEHNQAAVVGITTSGAMPAAQESDASPFGDNDNSPLSQFFRNMPRQHRGPMHAQGSGFLVSADGLILTNAHVVDGAKEVTVKLSDHREFKAKVLGADKSSDIAVLKIEGHGLPTVQIGNSDQIGVGDYVLAIGQPFGLEETATAGIVSAKGRSLPGDGYVPFIQTDAAVNPGNSGGPLFDSNGSVVGINSQIYSNSGGYQGVSFAIPINLAMGIENQIVKTGKVAHSRLGVEVQTLDQSLADAFKINAPNGALVAQVTPDSAAAKAGIKVGDVILKFDGAPIVDAGQLSARVGGTAPGDKASLDIWRDGKPMTITATIGSAAPSSEGLTAANTDGTPQLGLQLRALNSNERAQAGVDSGLVVEQAEGHAAEAGIERGDVVLSVDGTPVQTVAQLRGLVQQHGKQIALLIQRGDARLFVPVTLG